MYVRLDLDDMEGSLKIIKQAIEEDWWSQRIDIIRKEKEKIINELGFFPTLDRIIKENKVKERENKKEINNRIEDYFVFIRQKDQMSYDMCYNGNISLEDKMQNAFNDPDCVGFNTLGFFKNKIDKLEPSPYFKEEDGIYIKKDYYQKYIET